MKVALFGGSRSRTEPERGSLLYLAGVCFVASLGGLLFGFDTAVISGTVEKVTAQFSLTDLSQGWFASSALIGCIVGAVLRGRAGRSLRPQADPDALRSLFLCLRAFLGGSSQLPDLDRSAIVGGVGVGMASVLAPMYITELAPPRCAVDWSPSINFPSSWAFWSPIVPTGCWRNGQPAIREHSAAKGCCTGS